MPNRLGNATSPYLLQHKDNPVDWYEWGEEAFAEARERDVPVLLSVGYAACHWCHVMAHESFEDPETAQRMNRSFVNVKVDREERPDVDSIYMEAVQAMSGHGGWPMTVWLDHEARPFFAGTYFPKTARHGLASFTQVMEAVSEVWEERRADVREQAQRLLGAISRELPTGGGIAPGIFQKAYEAIAGQFDGVNGGFGGAPKFPQQPVLEYLLRIHSEDWAPAASHMVGHTLDRMAAGGIHDHIGGGFARYSVDDHWLVPHFEKMLYDNAQLARIYLWAGIELSRESFVDVAKATLDYMIRDLRHPDGGFHSSEDADSEGVEGKFYVWSIEEIRHLLGSDADAVIDYYGVTEEGNFEGSNILEAARKPQPDRLDEARSVLLAARSSRTRPGLDDKVVASWNGLAIRAFAEAGAVLGDDRYIEAARSASDFALENLVVGDKLMRSWRGGLTSVPGFLDDYAALSVGLLSLYSATGNPRWYQAAMSFVDGLGRFQDGEGGFYATASDAPQLIKRPRDTTDNPHPSGNALAGEALLMASSFTGDQVKREAVHRALSSVSILMDRYPSMVGHHLSVGYSEGKAREVAIVGPGWPELAAVYWQRFRPHAALAVSGDGISDVPLLADRGSTGETLAYVCRGFVCDLPTSDRAELAAALK